MVWKKELGAEQALATIKVDPTDWRHICLCGAKGSIVVLRLTNLAQNKVGEFVGAQGGHSNVSAGLHTWCSTPRVALWGCVTMGSLSEGPQILAVFSDV